MAEYGTMRVKSGLAEMLKGGVIMDVTNAEQARIAEEAGACAVMALERVPADIRAQGGVARMSDPEMIAAIQAAVTIPVMAKARIGHFVEAQVLRGARGRLHRRVRGADAGRRGAPHRQVEVRRAVRLRRDQPRRGATAHRRGRGDDPLEGRGRHRQRGRGGAPHALDQGRASAARRRCDADELYTRAKELQAPLDAGASGSPRTAACPSSCFTAGGIATPADAALMMQLGADGVFVGSGIFKSGDPAKPGPGDRRGDDATSATPKLIADVSRRHRRADGRPHDGGDPGRPAPAHARLVRPGMATIGVLALQGAFREHCAAVRRLGHEAVEVRTPADLAGVDALIIPGGESTTIDKLLDWQGLREPLQAALDAGMPTFGTCAGLIVLAASAVDGLPDQRPLAAIDIVAQRNGFGRQVRSFEAPRAARRATTSRCRACSSARRASSRSATASRSSRPWGTSRSRPRRALSWWRRSTPS